jgi:hypothetical protein
MDATTALAIYRAEKDKALRERRVSHVQLMAEAQEAFRKMLADAQLARKGGRPKGSTNAANAAPPAAVAEKAAAPVPSKLVLKTTKMSPAKTAEKVTPVATPQPKAKAPAKAAAAVAVAAKPEKRAEKKHPVAKARPVAKAAKRAAAPARKGSAKKSAAPRKQAASRERRAKAKKR